MRAIDIPTSLPPLAHSEAEIDPRDPWGSGGGSVLGVPEVPKGRWPLSSGKPPPPQAPKRGPALSLPLRGTRIQPNGTSPTVPPNTSASAGPDLTWHPPLRPPPPLVTVSGLVLPSSPTNLLPQMHPPCTPFPFPQPRPLPSWPGGSRRDPSSAPSSQQRHLCEPPL